MNTRLKRCAAVLLALALAGCAGTGNDQQAAVPNDPVPTPQASAAPSSRPSPEPQTTVEAPASAAPDQTAVETTPAATATAAPEESAPAAFDPQSVALTLEPVAQNLDLPLYVTHAGDGSGRLFVVEKGGLIRLLPNGETFLDITDRVNARGSEQGLLGLAFHPDFGSNGYVYVNYIDADGNTVVSRFNLGLDADAADPGSEQIVLRQEQPAANHNGGMLTFGPDGYLYIGLGDGGGANDQFGNGQNMQTLLGKLLRIDINSGDPYSVPADNPFVNAANTRPEIFAYGLRNPWRFSFDRATDELYIGDVGQNRFEWVHHQPANAGGGQNYGWPILEGTSCFNGNSCDRTGLTQAVIDYSHEVGCSVTGGYVYRGAQYPALQGAYVFGDYCSGRMWTLSQDAGGAWQLTDQFESGLQISSFGEDEAGELYLTSLGTGEVFHVTAQPR